MATLADLNALDYAAFVACLGPVFERSPWVAERVWAERPFASVAQLHERMVAVVARASREEQLALIRAHPELRGRPAEAPSLTAQSAQEQAGAGLNQADERELAELARLNGLYRARFGFPFILAVRGLGRAHILANLEARVANAPEREFDESLAQIARIAGFRLADLIKDVEGTIPK